MDSFSIHFDTVMLQPNAIACIQAQLPYMQPHALFGQNMDMTSPNILCLIYSVLLIISIQYYFSNVTVSYVRAITLSSDAKIQNVFVQNTSLLFCCVD